MAVADAIRRQMYEAVTSGAVVDMMHVVEKHPDVLGECWNASDSFLHLAAMKGQDDICAALIEAGLDVNAAGGASATPLGNAAAHGQPSTARLLLAKGAAVDGLPTSTATPLMNAAVDGHVDVARLLIDAGADVNREHLKLPHTALDFAIFYQVKGTGQAQVAELLRSHGAIRPYTEKHDWAAVPGQHFIEHVERALAGSSIH